MLQPAALAICQYVILYFFRITRRTLEVDGEDN